MEMRSATALRNDYDGMVRLSKEAQEAELDLLAEMLRREKSMPNPFPGADEIAGGGHSA